MKAANESLRAHPKNTVNKPLKSAAIIMLSAGIHAAILSVGNGFAKNTAATNSTASSETIKSKLEKYTEQYPDLKELPEIEQRAVIELHEENIAIVKKRKERRKIDPDKASAFRAEMANAVATNQLPTFKTFFQHQEQEVLGVDETTIADGMAYFEKITAKIQSTPGLDDLAKIKEFIKIFKFDQPTDDTANSVFECLVSIKEGRKPECNCKGRMKLTIMGLEALAPNTLKNANTQDANLHSRLIFKIDDKPMAIEGNKIVPAGNLAGTIVSRPEILVQRLADNSSEEVVPGTYEPGKKYPFITDDDQLNPHVTAPLKSVNPGIHKLYPALDERVRLLLNPDGEFEVQLFEPQTISASQYSEIMDSLDTWEENQLAQPLPIDINLLTPSPEVVDQVRSIYDKVDEIKSRHPDHNKYSYTNLGNVAHYDQDTLKKLLATKPHHDRGAIYSVEGLSAVLNEVLAKKNMVTGPTVLMINCWIRSGICPEQLLVNYFNVTGARGYLVVDRDFQLTEQMKQAIRNNKNLEAAPTTIKYLFSPNHNNNDTLGERVKFEVAFDS